MSYAIKKDGSGWRTINGPEDVGPDETYSEAQPIPIQPNIANEIRAQRDARLASCDWTQVVDSPMTAAQKTAWATYRQALRDVPARSGFPNTVTWPTAPKSN